jgi:hypothetical protein
MTTLSLAPIQVRQLITSIPTTDGPFRAPVHVLSHGPWHSVPSASWLIGLILPLPGFAYEFRDAPPPVTE